MMGERWLVSPAGNRDNAGNDVVIIFGVRRWPRDCR